MNLDELTKILTALAPHIAMFGGILVILRWFKTDTAEMIKLFQESTNKRQESTDKRIDVIEKTILRMEEEDKEFHKRLLEIELSRHPK